MNRPPDTATLATALRGGHGIHTSELAGIIASWERLDARLRSFPAGSVELDLSVKERGTPSQRTVLEARIPSRPKLVATSARPNVADALLEVRDDMIRQISDAKNRTEPRNNRALRTTTAAHEPKHTQ